MSGATFLSGDDDVQWVNDTALKGVPLPADYKQFKAFVIYGNEDAPVRIDLFNLKDPLITTPYLRIDFNDVAPFYCEYQEVKP